MAAAQTAIQNNLNQYTRMQGHPRLVKALASTYSPLFGRELDPMTDILGTLRVSCVSCVSCVRLRVCRVVSCRVVSCACAAANSPCGVAAVTVGATEGIFAVISALVNPGEEVIMLEPFYDAYPTDTILNEGVPVYVPLRPPKVPKGTITSGTRAVDCVRVRRKRTIFPT